MGSALLKLREQSRLFSTTEQEIAVHILENPQLVVDMSIHELAKHTFSSASSIVRLCNHTGYSGYKEFRKAVTYELAMREQSKRVEQKEIAHSDSLQDIIDNQLVLDDLKSDVIEVKLWEGEANGTTFPAYREDVYIEVTSYGGDTTGYQIPFTLHYTGVKVKGTFDVATKKFTAE